MNSPEQATTQAPPISMWTLLLHGWRDLVRSRETILRELYVNSASKQGVAVEDAMSLDELRLRVLQRDSSKPPPSEFAIHAMEHRLVGTARIVAAWIVLWTSVVPLGITVWWGVTRPAANPPVNAFSTVFTLVTSGICFVVAVFACLFLQAIFTKLFVAVANWFLRLNEVIH